MRGAPVLLGLLLLLMSAGLGGCRHSQFTPEAADAEVRHLVGQRRPCVPDVRGTLELCPPDLAARAARANPPALLTLEKALQIGTVASRDYLRAREDVYLAALAVSDARNPFRTRWNFGGSVGLSNDDGDLRVDSDVGGGLERDLTRGGQVLLGLTLSVLRDLAGSPIRIIQSLFDADVVLPLGRGSGALVAREALRQSERNLLYELRTYARFQRSFTVDIASRYFQALLQREIWKNEEATRTTLDRVVDEQTAKAEGEKISEFQVDQARQDLLRAEDRAQRARLRYESLLDTFKRELGLPVDATIELDTRDLDALRATGLVAAPFDLETAGTRALARRLDLLNARGRETDACRGVRVALDAMRAQVDLVLGGSADTPTARPLDLDSASLFQVATLVFDLPTERNAERNDLKRAMLEALRERRTREGLRDQVLFDVRSGFRDLEQAASSFRIQTQSVRLAERRVESTGLLLESGRASIRDRLEAQNALVQAQNALAQALVDHAIARLSLERDVGILAVDAEGGWTPTPPGGTSGAPGASLEVAPGVAGSGPAPAPQGVPGGALDSSALGTPP